MQIFVRCERIGTFTFHDINPEESVVAFKQRINDKIGMKWDMQVRCNRHLVARMSLPNVGRTFAGTAVSINRSSRLPPREYPISVLEQILAC